VMEPHSLPNPQDNRVAEKLASATLVLSGGSFQQDRVDRILAMLDRECSGSDDKAKVLVWAENVPKNANTEYLLAQLAMSSGNFGSAISHWERFFEFSTRRDPFISLRYANSLFAEGKVEESAWAVRRVLHPVPPYSFFTRAGKLIQGLSGRVDSWVRRCRVAILSTSTTSLLVPVLQALCLRDRIHVEFYEGLYGSIDQEVLDPNSGLARFRPDVVFILANWRSLQLAPIINDEAAHVESIVSVQRERLRLLHEKYGCHVVQQLFDFPVEDSYGYLASALEGGRIRILQRVNLSLQNEASSHVSFLDTPALQRQVGNAVWQDELQWFNFQQHPSTEALGALADVMAAHLRAILGLTRKVLVTDLDNTLWKGVIGEDGLSGIKIGPGSPHGEAHARLQQYLLELKQRGILLAVASKNNYEDACLPFQKHENMLLRLGDFVAFEANWDDKASSIREISRKLALGTDSFVFLDDSPNEREWVRSQIPDIAIVELGSSVFHYVKDLDRGQYFFALSLSSEDSARTVGYQTESARKDLMASAQSLDEFLARLQLRAKSVPIDSGNLARVTQLINKTNQFNLTTRRYTEGQIEELVQAPQCWCSAFHLADKMGDYGLIGVILCRVCGPSQWEIDTWLMSCRVLGRQMEKFMFDRLMEASQSRGIGELIGVYRPTPKNGLVSDHYTKLGFQRVSETPELVRYRLAVPQNTVRTALHIENEISAPIRGAVPPTEAQTCVAIAPK